MWPLLFRCIHIYQKHTVQGFFLFFFFNLVIWEHRWCFLLRPRDINAAHWLAVSSSELPNLHHCEEMQRNRKTHAFWNGASPQCNFCFTSLKSQKWKNKTESLKPLSIYGLSLFTFLSFLFAGWHKLSQTCSSSPMLYVWSIFSYYPPCAFYFFFSSNEKNKSLFCFVCLSFRFLTSHLLYIIHQTFCVMSECGSNQPAGIKEFTQKLCVKHFKHRSREKYLDLATQRLPPGACLLMRCCIFCMFFSPGFLIWHWLCSVNRTGFILSSNGIIDQS